MNSYAYQAYKKTQVSTASQGDLLIMLFEGAIRFSNQAIDAINESNFSLANEKLLRVQDIMTELTSALKRDVGEIAENLYQLYSYITQLLVDANIKKDIIKIEQAINLLTELCDTWREAVTQA